MHSLMHSPPLSPGQTIDGVVPSKNASEPPQSVSSVHALRSGRLVKMFTGGTGSVDAAEVRAVLASHFKPVRGVRHDWNVGHLWATEHRATTGVSGF